MQIQLEEGELEIAVADYIAKMGISYPVGDIQFRTTRGKAGSDSDGGVVTTVTAGEIGGSQSTNPQVPTGHSTSETTKNVISLDSAVTEPQSDKEESEESSSGGIFG